MCWCVCGLMMSVWPADRSSISSYISDTSEHWEIDCFTRLVFHSRLQSFRSNIQPEAILALPSVSNAEWCHPTRIPPSVTLTHEGQDHTSRSASYWHGCKCVKTYWKCRSIRITGFWYVRNQFIWYNINPQLYIQNKNAFL